MYTHKLWIDTETRSPVNLTTHGVYLYAEHSECIMVQYALDDGPVKVWSPDLGQPMPLDLHQYLDAPDVELVFHNVEFDRTNMIAWGWGKKYNLNARRFLCTMTWARMCRLPGGLEDLCNVLGVGEQHAKKDGEALIRMFCVPKGDGTFTKPQDDPAKWALFEEYGVHDILAMRECARRMPAVFNATERELYARTLEMNDRGIAIDLPLSRAAIMQADRLKAQYKKQGKELAMQATRDVWGSGEEIAEAGELNIASQKAVLEFIASYGAKLPDARANTIEKFLASKDADLLPETVRQLLATRLKANKASVAKYSALIKGVSDDGRIRGLINFYGAGTGRDAGRRFQPQNLARPVLLKEPKGLNKGLSMEEACNIVKEGTAELYFKDPMQLLSDCVRGALIPSEGNKFCGADLSAIEGRVLPWLAEEEWMVQYFRDFDAGIVRYDGYQLAYSTAFGVDPSTVTKDQRTLGKPIDLATGYGGGVGALVTFAAVYGIDLDAMAKLAYEAADKALWKDCDESYDWFDSKGLTLGLEKFTWTACHYIVKAWRNRRAGTVQLWKNCESAFENAITNPGVAFKMANKTYAMNNNGTVYVQLPSGRMLVYPQAHIADRGGRKQLAFMGVNPFSRKWGQIFTYGGKLCENIDQAVARDVLFWNIPRVEAAGYSIVARIHDELLTEAPNTPNYSGDEVARLIATPSQWCMDLPLKAVGEDLLRYQK